MTSYFDESYYLNAKLKQLSGTTDSSGNAWTLNSLKLAIGTAGLSPEQHYQVYGRGEKLNPNAYFNEAEYLATKLAALKENPISAVEWASKGVYDLIQAISNAGMNPAEHYEVYGAFETRGDGTLLNPSNAFDANAYFAAKLQQLIERGDVLNGKPATELSVADVVQAVKNAGLSPVSHYVAYGAVEAGQQHVPMVQTVPSKQRVPNDAGRAVTGEFVPGNYNPPSPPPSAAVAAPVVKPADMGGKVSAIVSPPVIVPDKALPAPGDAGYVAPPATLVDTNEKPVIPPSTAQGTGPNAGFIVVDLATGKGTVIKPNGDVQGTVDVKVDASGNITPPLPNAPVVDDSGKNTNDHPFNDADEPVAPVPDPSDPVGPPPPVLHVTYESSNPAADPVVYESVVLKFTNAASTVTLAPAAADPSKLVLTPASGAAHTLKDGFNPVAGTFIIDKSVTLKGSSDILKDKKVTALAADNVGNVVITAFDPTLDFQSLHEYLNVTAVIENSMTFEITDDHKNIDALSVNAGVTLTVDEAIGLSGRKLVGAGTVILNSKTKLQADLSVDTLGITGAGSVTSTFNEDVSGEVKTLIYNGGAGVDKLTLNRADTGGNYSRLEAKVDLGAGNDMLVLDGSGGAPAFPVDSIFKGGVGDDTLKVTNSDTVTDLTSLNSFATDGSGGGFEYLLLKSSGAATYDFSTISNDFKIVGFESGSGIYTLKNVDQKLVISNGAASGSSTPVKLALDTAISGDTLNLEFKELDSLKAAQAELSASLDMAAVLNNKTLNVSGSAVNDLLTLTADTGKFAAMKIMAAMGAGDDTVTFDLSGQTGLAFAANSTIDGGTGTNTIALIGGDLSSPFTVDFTNLGIKNIKTLDVGGIGTASDALTLALGNKGSGLTIKGNDTNKDTLIITAKAGVLPSLTTGSGDDDITYNITDIVTRSAFGVNADLGSGNDILTLDLGNFRNGDLAFASGSQFSGGAGADTLKLRSSQPIHDGMTFSFDNLAMTDVETMDVSGVVSSNASLHLVLSEQATGLAIQGDATTKNQVWITAKPGVTHTVTTGSGDDTFQYDFVSGAGNSFKANLGAGRDTVNLDFGSKLKGHLEFTSGSFIDGDGNGTPVGSEVDDTIILKGTLSGALHFDFTNLALTGIEKLDLNSITGDTVTNRVALTFDKATTLSVSGISGGAPTYMNMGDSDDAITFIGNGGRLTIDTGKGADVLTLTLANGSDTVILDAADFFTVGSGSFTPTNLDTLSGFNVSGSTTSLADKLGVSTFIAKGSQLATAPAKNAAVTVTDDGIYVIKDAAFTNTQVADADAAFAALFSTNGTDNYFKTVATEQTKAVVVVQGTAESYVFYIDSVADSTSDFSAADIAYVAKMPQITNTTGGVFTIDNFI